MITEGRGISEINKIETENIFNLFKNVGFKLNIDYLFDNMLVKINFNVGNYNSNFNYNNKMFILNFNFPMDYNIIKTKEIITHEITHLIEIKNITTKKLNYPNYNTIKKSLLMFNPVTKEMQFFKHMIYKILDNEINANVSQTYTYLNQFDSDDNNFLLNKLDEYEKRIEYISLLNFNYNKLITDIKNNELVRNELISLNNLFINNNVDKFLNFIYVTNIDIYIRNWFKLAKININKLLKKQINIIDEVIEDQKPKSNDNILESTILSFNDYIKL